MRPGEGIKKRREKWVGRDGGYGEGRRVWAGTEGMGSDGGYGEGRRVWGVTEGMGRDVGYGE